MVDKNYDDCTEGCCTEETKNEKQKSKSKEGCC